jgi:hypothetical protein
MRWPSLSTLSVNCGGDRDPGRHRHRRFATVLGVSAFDSKAIAAK